MKTLKSGRNLCPSKRRNDHDDDHDDDDQNDYYDDVLIYIYLYVYMLKENVIKNKETFREILN